MPELGGGRQGIWGEWTPGLPLPSLPIPGFILSLKPLCEGGYSCLHTHPHFQKRATPWMFQDVGISSGMNLEKQPVLGMEVGLGPTGERILLFFHLGHVLEGKAWTLDGHILLVPLTPV